jgi:hypothetical protein
LQRVYLIYRAQSDLLGSFRHCAGKSCRRARTCRGDDPEACRKRLWRRKKVRPKALRREWYRLSMLRDL